MMRRYALDIYGYRFGVEKSTVYVGSLQERYLSRWILYWGWGTLRLHKFWRGDDQRASHTHPWWFITIPLRGYLEKVYEKGVFKRQRWVKPFRPHYRPRGFEHVVVESVVGVKEMDHGALDFVFEAKPFWTIVLTGGRDDAWGFYPRPGRFIVWHDYTGHEVV